MAIFRYSVIAILLFFIHLKALAVNVDSLDKELIKHQNDSIGVTLCSDLEFHYELSDFSKARYYAFKGLEIAKRIKWLKGIALSYSNCFWLYKNHVKYDSALVFRNQLHQFALKHKLRENEADSYLMQGSINHAKRKYADALASYDKAFSIFTEIKSYADLARCYNNTGNIYDEMGEFDKAIQSFKEAIKIRQKIKDDKGIVDTKVNIAVVYVKKAKYEEAVNLFLEAAHDYDKMDNQYQVARQNANVAVVYSRIKNHLLALKYTLIAIKVLEKLQDRSTLALIYNNAGAHYMDLGDYKNALVYYEKALDMHADLENEIGVATSYNNIGSVYNFQKKFSKSIDYFHKALALKIKNNETNTLPVTYYNLGSSFIGLKNVDSSLYYLKIAEELSKPKGMNKELADIYKAYADVYEIQNDFKKAFAYFKLHKQFADSTLDSDIGNKIVELEAIYQNNKKELENKRLTIKNQKERIQRLKAENESARKSRMLLVFVFAGVLVISLLLLYFQQRKRKMDQLHNQKILAEREKGLEAVITATEEERKRIAKDLHDGVGQQMTGLKMAWQKLSAEIHTQSPEQYTRLVDITKVLDDASADVRSISHQMMPRVLTEMGLVPALEDMLAKVFKYSDIKYEFLPINLKDRFQERIELCLYRVCQELVNNVIKHSGATQLMVQLIQQKDYLVMIVEDNGKGLQQNSGKGIGMLSMSSRLNVVHGVINYDPGPQTGTLVTIRVPLA